MEYTSYAQNFEDVNLHRAFSKLDPDKHTFIDVGAAHPVINSVSRHFAEMGWDGIFVEPDNSFYFELLKYYPKEMIIKKAISDRSGVSEIYVYEHKEYNTVSTKRVEDLKKEGILHLDKIKINTITLNDLLEIPKKKIAWLKLDIEGQELKVIENWNGKIKPICVVIETNHLNETESKSIRKEMNNRNYKKVLYDGLNEFFLHKDEQKYTNYLSHSACILDRFTLTSNSGFVGDLFTKYKSELDLLASDNRRMVSELDLLASDNRRMVSELDLLASDNRRMVSELDLLASDNRRMVFKLVRFIERWEWIFIQKRNAGLIIKRLVKVTLKLIQQPKKFKRAIRYLLNKRNIRFQIDSFFRISEESSFIQPVTSRFINYIDEYNFENTILRKRNYSEKIDVVISTKSFPKELEISLNALLKVEKINRIIIIMNQCFDNIRITQITQNPKIKTIKYDHNFNWSKQTNIGIMASESEYVYLLNDDCYLEDFNWVESNIAELNKRQAIIGHRLLYPQGIIQHDGMYWSEDEKNFVHLNRGFKHVSRDTELFDLGKTFHKVEAVTGASMLFSKEIWKLIGGFDENLTQIYQDVDFCLKAKELGVPIIIDRNNYIFHVESKTINDFINETPIQNQRMLEYNYFINRWIKYLNYEKNKTNV